MYVNIYTRTHIHEISHTHVKCNIHVDIHFWTSRFLTTPMWLPMRHTLPYFAGKSSIWCIAYFRKVAAPLSSRTSGLTIMYPVLCSCTYSSCVLVTLQLMRHSQNHSLNEPSRFQMLDAPELGRFEGKMLSSTRTWHGFLWSLNMLLTLEFVMSRSETSWNIHMNIHVYSVHLCNKGVHVEKNGAVGMPWCVCVHNCLCSTFLRCRWTCWRGWSQRRGRRCPISVRYDNMSVQQDLQKSHTSEDTYKLDLWKWKGTNQRESTHTHIHLHICTDDREKCVFRWTSLRVSQSSTSTYGLTRNSLR